MTKDEKKKLLEELYKNLLKKNDFFNIDERNFIERTTTINNENVQYNTQHKYYINNINNDNYTINNPNNICSSTICTAHCRTI